MYNSFMLSDIVRIMTPAAMSFLIGIGMTPLLTHYLYAYKAWKKTPGKTALNGDTADEFNRLHNHNETRAPRMGGIIIWASVLVTTVGLFILEQIVPSNGSVQLNFLSRSQTWIPLAALLIGALVGLADDILVIRPGGEGMQLRHRLLIVLALSIFIGWWFWAKLGVVAVNIPLAQPLFSAGSSFRSS